MRILYSYDILDDGTYEEYSSSEFQIEHCYIPDVSAYGNLGEQNSYIIVDRIDDTEDTIMYLFAWDIHVDVDSDKCSNYRRSTATD